MAILTQLRRDLRSEWERTNPIIHDGEMILVRETESGPYTGYKIGDGVKTFNELEYGNNGSVLQSLGTEGNAAVSQKVTTDHITEYNVSKQFPTGGVSGGNTYTLEAAIAKVPVALQTVGMRVTFISNETSEFVTYLYKGNSWVVGNFFPLITQEFGDSTTRAISQRAVSFGFKELRKEMSENVYFFQNVLSDIIPTSGKTMQYAIKSGDIFKIIIENITVGANVIVGSVLTENATGFYETFLDESKGIYYEIIVTAKENANYFKYWASIANVKVTIEKVASTIKENVEKLNELVSSTEDTEFIYVMTDVDNRIIESIDKKGIRRFYSGVYVDKLNDEEYSQIINPEFIYAVVDKNDKLIYGVTREGDISLGIGVPKEIKEYVRAYFEDYNKSHISFGSMEFTAWAVLGRENYGGRKEYCIAIGNKTLMNNTGVKNIAIGNDNMYECVGHDNTSVGYHASFRNTSGNVNSAFGSESQDDNTTGSGNSSLGFCSMQRNNTGSNNTVMGSFAMQGGSLTKYEKDNPKSYTDNVVVGALAMQEALPDSNYNVAIGKSALNSKRKYINNIAIGKEADCDKDNQTVIGNDAIVETIVRGDLIVKGTDGIKRQIVFNDDGSCTWVTV